MNNEQTGFTLGEQISLLQGKLTSISTDFHLKNARKGFEQEHATIQKEIKALVKKAKNI